MKKRHRSRALGGRSFRPRAERMEVRLLLTTADGTGPVVVGLTQRPVAGGAALVVSFDGPLDPALAQDPALYRVEGIGAGNPEFVTETGHSVVPRWARYDAETNRVTLRLASTLRPGVFHRIKISGTPGAGLTGADGTLFDGDFDDTPGGDFYALFARGRGLRFADLDGDTATLRLRGPGALEVWRELDGDVNVASVVDAGGRTLLAGAVLPGALGDGLVVIPTVRGLTPAGNRLADPPFPTVAPDPVASPTPVVATPQNLPFTLQIEAVPMPSVPSLQSAVYAQADGKWLLFGGRTNGLHGFNSTGLSNFPPLFQNQEIIVIDPATGQTWTRSWSSTGLPQSVTTSLASTNQNFYQEGDRLYAVGGYSFDPAANQFRTYDTLTSISVSGLMNAVIGGGDVASQVRQSRDPRLAVTGGQMDTIDGRTYLVFGQNFQGGYSFPATATQIYTDEVRSFRIFDDGSTLAITDYVAQRDSANFRRRDYPLAPVIFPDGRPGLTVNGGVFTPDGNAYRTPVEIGPDGTARVDTRYQQFFSQYDTAKVALFDARDRSMNTIFFGGISLYHYDFATGTLTQDTEMPFVNDVTTLVRRADGSRQEYIMPSQLPARLGAESAFFASPGLPTFENGVIRLDQLPGPTTLGYIYGGILSTVGNTENPLTQTTASNLVFKVTLVPR